MSNLDGKEKRYGNQGMEEIKDKLADILVKIGIVETKLENYHRDKNQKHEDAMEEINIHEKILNGNGHPENGLVYKAERNTEFRLFWQKFGWLILAGFSGIPCTVIAAIVIHAVAK